MTKIVAGGGDRRGRGQKITEGEQGHPHLAAKTGGPSPFPEVSVHVSRLTRAGLAAALVLGVGAALPSLAAEHAGEGAVYTDDSGFIELPAPLASTSDYTFDFMTCPEAPPNQGIDAWVYALPEEVALGGAPVTITGTDSAGTTGITAYVYDDDCTYDRVVSSDAALTFALEDNDRYLAATTAAGVGTALVLEVAAAPTGEPTPTTSPTTGPGGGGGAGVVMTRGDYSGGVDDPYYPETSTGPVGDISSGGQWGMRIIRAEQAWQQPQATGAGIRVAVLDSGMDVTHEDFQCPGKIARLDAAAYPRFADVTDTDGHGTHVAGIVGACTDNGTGVVGTAPDATILPIKALSETDATADRLAEAIRAAADNGAHVINMSLGFSAQGLPGTGSAIALAGGFADDIDPAIEYAVSKGVVVVAAAGNESFPVCGYPALAADVVCVGSTDRRDLNAWYGNFPITPSGVALVAPGGSGQVLCDVQSENVLSTYSTQADNACAYPAEGYRGLDGTSMAAPHVAGVAALVYDRLGGERSPAAAAAVKQALVDGAVDLYTPGYDPMSGEGRVDALGAVQAVTAVTPSPTATPTPSPTATAGTTTDLALIAPGTGSTTDSLPVAARLSEGDDRVSGAAVEFELVGPGGSRTASGTTDADGVTTAELPLDLAPGSYTLTATYAGEGSREGSSVEQAVTVVRDTTATTLVVDGKGGNRTLTVTLQDADDAPTGLAGRTVVLFADGREIGTVTTGSDGTATFAPTGKDRSAKAYEARFAGDDSYEGSTATA